MLTAKVLVVSGEITQADSLRATLEGLGHGVLAHALSGEEAIALHAAHRPDLVLIDVDLPGAMDGIETAAALRRDGDAAVVYLAPSADEAALARAVATRPHGYLLRPVTDGALRATLEIAIHQRTREQVSRVTAARDAARQREMERRLELSERLASIGALAASTAHELNNILVYVVANVDIVAEALGDLERKLHGTGVPAELIAKIGNMRDASAEAVEGATKVRLIAHDFRTFVRTDERHSALCRLPDVIESALKMTIHLLKRHARINKTFGATPPVRANEGQLTQVFVNLLTNAAHALPEGRAHENEISIVTGEDAQGRATVEIRDTGCGIPKDLMSQLFQPFFTTKPVGVGSGLGLSVCKAIVLSLDGQISVESEPGAGSTFRVALPAAVSPPRPPSIPALPLSAPAQPKRRGRVYVIDDDEAIVRAVERLLQDEHDVVIETRPVAALEHLLQCDGYDIIVCDVTMQRMDGIALYRALSSSRPDLAERLVFMTGGAVEADIEDFLLSRPLKTIAKPFTPKGLRSFVRDQIK